MRIQIDRLVQCLTMVAATFLTAGAVNAAPVANNQDIGTVGPGKEKVFALSYSGSPTSFTIVTNPGHGTLRPYGASYPEYYYYTASAGYEGPDAFTWRCIDASGSSGTATCSVVVSATPVANNQASTVATGGEILIYLSYSDPMGVSAASRVFTILSGPAQGTLQSYNIRNSTTSYPDRYYYKPTAGYTGPDSFTWKLNNGYADSGVAAVSVTVNTNTAPIANNRSYVVGSSARSTVILSVTHPDSGQPMTYTLVSGPSHGTVEMPLSGTTAYYTSDLDYVGTDSFTWQVSDGLATSGVATNTITVYAIVPVPQAQTACVAKDTAADIPALFTGGGGYVKNAVKVAGPSHGTVTASGTTFHYTPATGYTGPDSFTWYIAYSNATTALTNTATVACSITVKASTGTDWPQWRLDECRSGQTTMTLPAALYLQWRRDGPAAPASTTSGKVTTDPVQLGKTIFVPGGANDTLTAYDTDSGAMKWRFYTSGAVRRPPVAVTLSGGTNVVIFGSEDGYVYCLNEGDGSVRWQHAPPSQRKAMGFGRLGSVWPVRGSPAAYQGRVYFVQGYYPFEGVYAFCLDAATGTELWRNDGAMLTAVGGPTGGWGGNHSGSAIRATAGGQMCVDGPVTLSYDHTRMYEGAQLAWSWALDTATGAYAGQGGTGAYCIDGNGNAVANTVTITAGGQTFTASSVAALGVVGTASSIIAGDGKLFVTTTQGSLYCFGGTNVTPTIYTYTPTPLPAVSDGWTTAVSNMLSRADLKQGLALVWGIGSGRLVEELAKQAPSMMIVAADPDPVKVRNLRVKMDAAGLSGARVSTLTGNPMDFGFAPFQAALIASEDASVAGYPAGGDSTSGLRLAKKLYKSARPFGGEIWLPTSSAQHTALAGWLAAANFSTCGGQPSYAVVRKASFPGLSAEGFTQIQRTGLPDDKLALKPPFGVIAYGDSSSGDYYSGLPFSGTMPGYGPPSPALNNTSLTANELIAEAKKLVSSHINPLYDQRDSHTSGGGWPGGPVGCGINSAYGSVIFNSGSVGPRGFSFTDVSSVYWGRFSVRYQRVGCGSPGGNARYGVVSLAGTTCNCFHAMNSQTVALATLDDDQENWICYRTERSLHSIQDAPVRRVGVNFGAIGDRYLAEDGLVWTHHPVQRFDSDYPALVPVSYRGAVSSVYRHSAQLDVSGNDRPRNWVAASYVKGMSGLSVHLANPLVLTRVTSAPVADGTLSEACWISGSRVEMSSAPARWRPAGECADGAYAMLRYDDTNLYIGAGVRGVLPIGQCYSGSAPADYGGQGLAVAINDLVFMCGPVDGKLSTGISTSAWQEAHSTTAAPFSAELVIPWSALNAAGVFKEQMTMNVYIYGSILNGSINYMPFSIVGDYRSPVYIDVARGPVAQAKPHTVRLYFAEMEGKTAGQRAFDVKLQGQTVLSNLDVVSAAGGPKRELVREVTGVQIADKLDIDFTPRAGEPMLSGVEIVGTYTDAANQPPVAVPGASVVSGPAPLEVTLSASGSYDPDGWIADYVWETGDGRLAKGPKVQHVFAEPGTYKVNLLVLDNRSATATTSVTVTVTAGVPAAFVCKIRKSGGDYTNLATWEAAIRSDLTTSTRVFEVAPDGQYRAGETVTFTGGGSGDLLRVATNETPPVVVIANVSGTVNVGPATMITSYYNKTTGTFTILDTGVPLRSLLFTVTDRGTYAAADDGTAVTFTGSATGVLKHINGTDIAYIEKCRGTIMAGAVTCASGRTFTVADEGHPICTAVAEGYNDWPAGLVGTVTLESVVNGDTLPKAGWITDPTHGVTIRAAAGQGHSGKLKDASGNYTGFALKGSLIAAGAAHTRVERVIVDPVYTLSVGLGGSVNRVLAGAVTAGRVASPYGTPYNPILPPGGKTVVANTVGTAFTVVNAWGVDTSDASFYNCTGTTFDSAGRRYVRFVNCLSFGGTGFATRGGGSNLPYSYLPYANRCVSTDGTATVMDDWADGREGNFANQTVTFVNVTSNDFHLADTDLGARGLGVLGLGADIDGQERPGPYYDVGADQNAAVLADANFNGLPDAWEIQYFGSTNAANGGPNADADGDGMSNYAEWRAGTIPTNALSRLEVTGVGLVSGTNFVIRWSSVGGKFYAIDASTNLLVGFPVNVLSNITATPALNIRTVQVDQAAQRFFRVRVQ